MEGPLKLVLPPILSKSPFPRPEGPAGGRRSLRRPHEESTQNFDKASTRSATAYQVGILPLGQKNQVSPLAVGRNHVWFFTAPPKPQTSFPEKVQRQVLEEEKMGLLLCVMVSGYGGEGQESVVNGNLRAKTKHHYNTVSSDARTPRTSKLHATFQRVGWGRYVISEAKQYGIQRKPDFVGCQRGREFAVLNEGPQG